VPHRFASVDDYIASFPDATQLQLARVRRAIREAVPGTAEKISYGMATVTLDDKPLVYFAGWKRHVGLYPAPTGDADFERAIAPYRAAKETVRFPTTSPVPVELVTTIARLCVERRADAASGSLGG
jgi:uncharacterized protein YdhG (YjbR/CyaY superfamily)